MTVSLKERVSIISQVLGEEPTRFGVSQDPLHLKEREPDQVLDQVLDQLEKHNHQRNYPQEGEEEEEGLGVIENMQVRQKLHLLGH